MWHKLIRPDFALACILIAAALLRFHAVGAESLWLDEAFSAEMADSPVSTIIVETAKDVHPPLYYIALNGWVRAAGLSEAGVRSMSVVLSLVTIVIVYALGRQLFGPGTGLLAAFFLAVSPFQIEFAQEARMYTMLAFFSVISIYCLARQLTPGNGSRWWLVSAHAMSTSLMLYTQAYSYFIVAAEALVLVSLLPGSNAESRHVLKRCALGLALAVVLFLPWLPTQMAQVLQVQRGFWIPEGGSFSLAKTFALYAGSVPLAWMMGFFAMAGVIAAVKSPFKSPLGLTPRRVTVPLTVLWCVCPILLPFLISQVASPIFMSKYTLAASLAFSLLAAHGIVSLFGRAGLISAMIVAVALTWSPLQAYYGTTRKVKWRETIAALDRAAQPLDLVLLNQSFSDIPFHYYSHRNDLVVVPFLKHVPVAELTPRAVDVLLSVAAAGHQRVWVVLSNPDSLAEAIVRHFKDGYTVSSHTLEWGLEIYLFDREKR